LIAVPPSRLATLLRGLHEPDALAAVIGTVESGTGIAVEMKSTRVCRRLHTRNR
jgi:hypothetical protein